MLKICFVIGNLSYSGAEKILYYLILQLYKEFDISVILISCEKKTKELPKEVKQYPIFNKNEEVGNRIIRTHKRKNRIRKIIRENDFNVVVSFGVKFNLDVVEASRKMDPKVILCERNDPSNDPKSKILRIRRLISYRHADAFVFQTEDIRNFFSKSIRKKSVIIPNFVEKEYDNKYIGVKHNNSFITCARLDDNQKNQTLLIKTFAQFLNVHPDYQLIIIGNGPDRDKYLRLVRDLGISDSVILFGKCNSPIDYLPSSKCFILTSNYEGMPNSLIEAMSIGMPCISTNCSGGGARFLIENDRNGILVDRGNPDELLRAMLSVADGEADLISLSKEAHKINKVLDKEEIIKKWKKLIINLANK